MKHLHFDVETDGFYGAYWACAGGSSCAVIAMIGDDPEDRLARSTAKWLCGRLSRYAASARGRVQNLDDFYDGSADTQGHRGGIPFGRKLCAPEAFYGKGVGRTDTRCTAQ